MERFLRKMMEKLGASVDGFVGPGSTRLPLEEMIAALYQAVERNLAEDPHGISRIAPSRMTLALSYEIHVELKEAALEIMGQELTAAVESYIHDHRYGLQSMLTVEVLCDPFLRKPFEVRAHRESDGEFKSAFWLESNEGRRVVIDFGPPPRERRLTLGRTGDNDVVINDPTVSRFHASLMTNKQGEVIVSDLGSANGTFVNGQRIGSSHALRTNDELTLGSVSFIFRCG
jgi:hypothetical protein